MAERELAGSISCYSKEETAKSTIAGPTFFQKTPDGGFAKALAEQWGVQQ